MRMRFTPRQLGLFKSTGKAPREMRRGPKEPAGELRLNGRQLGKFIMAFGTEILVDILLQKQSAQEDAAAGLSVDAVPKEDDPASEVLASSAIFFVKWHRE